MVTPPGVDAQEGEESPQGPAPTPEEALEIEEAESAPEEERGTFRAGSTTLQIAPADVFRASGSVAVIDEEELDRLGYSDPTNIVQRVPGVIVRVEDGFGLRPNIAIRGTNPERSRGVALMEDGVLFGPAPYSAPAAYYFPIVDRMTGVEVQKGPAAILYGPQTTGGAVNFLSREVPTTPSGELRLAYGSYGSRVGRAHYGMSNARAGFLAEVVDLGSEGYKRIDGSSATTGFSRTEGVLRGFVQSSTTRRVYHRLGARLTYSRERSNETYLGLTDADIDASPDRRYLASELDLMRWQRFGYALEHRMEAPRGVTLVTTLYRHDFHRDWHRFDRFGAGGPSVLDVLAQPTGVNAVYLGYLRGDQDSDPALTGTHLIAANNDRTFVSQGAQTLLSWERRGERAAHHLRVGVRLHQDSILRHHTSESYLSQTGQLVRLPGEATLDRHEKASTFATAIYATYAVDVGILRITPGVRTEIIDGHITDYLDGTRASAVDNVWLGGLGVNLQPIDALSVFAGVHRGFAPVAPGGAGVADPESSVDFELGTRWHDEERGLRAEIAGFSNVYQNMLLTCTAAGGCPVANVDKQFNAGEAIVYGVEASYAHSVDLPHGLELPLAATYAFMRSRFLNAFTSGDAQYRDVEVGDEVPYLPAHQATLGAGVRHDRFSVNASGTFVGAMREQAGHGDAGFFTDRQAFVDVSGEVRLHGRIHLTLRAENLTDARPVVAHRPYGARPYRPRMAMVGLRVEL